MPLRQKTNNPAAFTLDQSFVPLKIENQAPSNAAEDYPIPNYQFAIQILRKDGFVDDDAMVALFQKVSGMKVEREIDPLSEGGHNEYSFEFPGQISYSHITFEKGLTASQFFYNWMMAGKYKGFAQSLDFNLLQRRPNPNYALASANLDVTDQSAAPDPNIFEVVKTWEFHDAFPVKWKISDLSMGDSKNIVIETLELSFNWFELAIP